MDVFYLAFVLCSVETRPRRAARGRCTGPEVGALSTAMLAPLSHAGQTQVREVL